MRDVTDRLPVQLSQASGVPFYRQVVDQVAQLIRSGQIAPGSRLPSVRELSGQLLVSLITVRRSYSDLEAAGLIIRRQGQGTFVAERVEAVSRRHALEETREHVAAAVAQARSLGLGDEDLRDLLDQLLEGEPETGAGRASGGPQVPEGDRHDDE